MARNREKELSMGQSSQPLNAGYSEKQQALDVEANSGDFSFQKRGRGTGVAKDQSKTLDAYRDITKDLDRLVESYLTLLEKDLRQAQKIMADIKKMRQDQNDLLDRLFGSL